MDVSVSARIIANSLNTASTSREIPQEFRYHATVLNDHLADVLRSGLFDDIDHFFKMLEAHVRNRRARSRLRGRFRSLHPRGAHTWRLRLRQGVSCRTLYARSHDPAHRAGKRRDDPLLHRRTSAGPTEVVLDINTSITHRLPGHRTSEACIGRAISHRRREFILATKYGCHTWQTMGAPNVHTAANIRSGVEHSLHMMRTDYLDIAQFHQSLTRDSWKRKAHCRNS
jgi:hypothetical protein